MNETPEPPEQNEPGSKKSPFKYTYEDFTGPDGPRKRRQVKLIGAAINAAVLTGVFAAAAAFGAFDGEASQLSQLPSAPYSATLAL